jgi:hypothetical protein
MQAQLPYAELRDNDTRSVPGMEHYAHRLDRSKNWCGAPRDPGKPWDWSPNRPAPDCVVCQDLYRQFGYGGWLLGLPS